MQLRLTSSVALIFISILLCSSSLHAQELEPRLYSNLPVGQNFLAAGYVYSDGEINPAPGVPIENGQLTLKGKVVGYARSIDLWGTAGKVDASWAQLCFKGSAVFKGEYVAGDRCGSSDPSVRLSYLFYGAPAMDLAQFSQTARQRVIGVSFKVTAPLGDYNNENLINSGSNRWSFKPEIGISNEWGEWSVEASLGGTFYTDNDSFSGHVTLQQNPLYQLQSNLIYHLRKGRWISLNGNYFWGGRTEKNGVKADDRQKNSRLGITLAWPLTAEQSLKFYANKGVINNIGNDSDTYGVVWQYRWAD